MNEEIQHFSVLLESTTCLATIHSHLTDLVSSYFSFLFDKSSKHSLSFESKANSIQVTTEGFQKSGKYKVTSVVTNEEIQHFSVSPGSNNLPSYYSFLFDKSSAYSLCFRPKANSILVTTVSEKNRKYGVTNKVTNREIQHFRNRTIVCLNPPPLK